MKIFYILGIAFLICGCVSSSKGTNTVNPAPVVDRSATVPAPISTVPVQRATVQTAAPVPGSLADRADVQAFIRQMSAKHGFDQRELNALFGQARARSDVVALMKRPAESKTWRAYRKIFLTSKRIRGGATFWKTHATTLARAEQNYGVPAEIVVAVIGVETMYGGNTGKHKVLEALATLAFDYPRRADFFRKELENYLVLTRQEGIDPLSLKGSYAGAMGLGQFMPSSYLSYAVDFDGDDRRDLWNNPTDAIGSVANYLSKHRWERGGPVALPARVEGSQYISLVSSKLQQPQYPVKILRQRGVTPRGTVSDQRLAMLLKLAGKNGSEYWLGFANFYVITRYNHSSLYAMAVYQLSQEIRGRFKG